MKKICSVVLASFFTLVAFAQTRIDVQVHKVVEEGEQFNVTFVINGDKKVSEFSLDSSDDFQLLYGPQKGTSSSISIINGKTTKNVQSHYTYIFRAEKAGNYSLPVATAKVGDEELKSSPVVIEVVSSGGTSSSQQSSGASQGASQGVSQESSQASPSAVSEHSTSQNVQDLELVLSLDKRSVVIGEPIVAVLKLYTRVEIAGFDGVKFPTFEGFWSQEIYSPDSGIEFQRESYNGKIYNSAVLKKFLIVPQQEGKLVIEPAELVSLVTKRVSGGGQSFFDSFFDEYRTIRQKVFTKTITVNVAPLPAGAPASFSGGVGTFKISASLSKSQLKTHEAASLVLTVSGNGNVALLTTPDVVFPPDFEVYDTKTSQKIDKNGMKGVKTYEFPFIPRSKGDFTIEPIKYSYYDIAKRKYVTLQTEPLSLVVEQGEEAESSGVIIQGNVQKDVKSLATDIRFINMKPQDFRSDDFFFVGTTLYYLLLASLVVIALILWLSLKRMAARRADVVGTKNRKATKMAKKRFKTAKSYLKQGLATAFYEEMYRAMLGYVSDKLNIPVVELSKENIAEMLETRSVSKADIDSYIAVLDECEFARYAPSNSDEQMEVLYAKAVDSISSIDSTMKSKKRNNSAVLMLLLFFCLPLAANAQTDCDSLWNKANVAYSEGLWTEAADAYQSILDQSQKSSVLYYNLANSYFKMKDVPRSILNYERALKLDPSNEDARFNLSICNEQIVDRIDPVPELILMVWLKKCCYLLSSNTWAVVSLIFAVISAAMVLLFLLAGTAAGKRAGFFSGLVAIVFTLTTMFFAFWQKSDYLYDTEAIIMRPVTAVKSSPDHDSSTDLFVLHEGTKVRVLDNINGWVNIELADGRQGWLEADDMENI